MSKIIKTRNLSASQTLQYFNSSKSCENEKLKLDEIKLIYDFLYEDSFPNILIQNKESFLNLIENIIQEIIEYHFDDTYINTSFFQQTINKYKKDMENKYLNDYALLNETYQNNKSNLKENERKYLEHFLKHCINTCQYAYHHCPNNKKGKFILVEEKDIKKRNKNSEIKYVICIDCKQCYPSTCISMICTPCNIEYFSSVLKENEDINIVLATWEKYHCGGSLQDQVMKCIKCKRELYLNLSTNKLICKNRFCKFESKPKSILWKCSFCSKDFRSKVKVYNPLEFQRMKNAINNTLIMKIKANPSILPCCKKAQNEIKDLTFFHKEECKGVLFKGVLSGKEILVCRACHAMNFFDKFNWICPLCGKKFHIQRSTSVTPFKSMKNLFNNNKDAINKKPTRIFFLRKDSSSSFNNNDLNNEKNLSKKENKKHLNLTKDETISSNINSYKNIFRRNNYIKNKNNETDYFDRQEKENDETIKMIKIPSKEKDKNIKELRYGYKNRNIYLELENGEIIQKYKRKKRKTLYEVLQDRKKQSIGSVKNTSLKNTIETVMVEKNLNRSKDLDDEKRNIDISYAPNKSTKKSLLNNNGYKGNNDEINKKYYGKKVNKLIDDENNTYRKDKKLNIVITNKNSQDNPSYRNKNYLNFMNSSDDLLKNKELVKCKSYNLFNNENDPNNNLNSNKNNVNHQTNYLYTTNSNYNIKVSLNINHNICPYPKKDENEIKNISKKELENNYKEICQNPNLNKIKEIYLQEILKNTGINVSKNILSINDENNITNNNNNNKSMYFSSDNKKYIKNNNIINKKLFSGNSPKNIYNKHSIGNSPKNEKKPKIGHLKNKKDFYYNTSNNIIQNSFLNSTKAKDSKKTNKDFNFNSEKNRKNEPKKLIATNNKFYIMNKYNNTSSSNNKINAENKKPKRYNLNYLKINNKNNNEQNNKNLNNIQEYIKEEDDSFNNKSKITNLNDNSDSIINNNNNNKNVVKDKFKYDLMKNVIVSAETMSQLAKDSVIPIFSDKDFRYVRPIGEGAYGLIYLVENMHNRKQFALKKIICKDLYEIMKHKNQLELIYSMNHKNIMEIYNLQYKHLDSTTYAIYVLMERAQNDWSIDIRKRIINKKPYKEEEIINILKQVVSALAYLQRRNIAHRDIKPQNILLFKGNIFKVADLGEATNVNNTNKHMTLRGSELYMSPSLYERHKFNRKDAFHNAFKSDVFSLGFSTLYAMQLNLKIIENIRELSNMKLIISSINKDMGKKIYSDKLMKIIFKMIEVDENKRLDFIELEKELNCNF